MFGATLKTGVPAAAKPYADCRCRSIGSSLEGWVAMGKTRSTGSYACDDKKVFSFLASELI